MPSWGEILVELQTAQQRALQTGQPVSVFDDVRRKYLQRLNHLTQRAVVLYASRWTQPVQGVPPDLISITPEDIQGLMEVLRGLSGPGLDLILHSPGGSGEATEALVSYLRSKFSDIRVFIPHAAMSAATMLACSANRIVMGKHSFIGPIDPQFILQTELGPASVPAKAIEEQFELAKKEILANPDLLPVWLPILRQYGPALIVQCGTAKALSESLVGEWLARYMFAGYPDGGQRALEVAARLADHGNFKSHSRFINRQHAKNMGLVVDDLEDDQELQDCVLSVFHATSHTFGGTPCVKIIENHLGRAFIKIAQAQMVAIPQAVPPTPPGGSPKPPA